MKKAFDFIKHAVAKKDLDERLTAIHCLNDRVQAYNGRIVMEHPIDNIGSFSVSKDQLIKAVEVCNWEPEIEITEKSIILTHDNTKIRLNVSLDFEPQKKKKGKKKPIKKNLLKKLTLVRPFISEDASRTWSTSVRLSENYMHATNNVVIVRTPFKMRDCTIPVEVIDILLKIKESPTIMAMSKNSIYFEWKNGAWMQGILLFDTWPKFKELFDARKKVKEIPTSLYKAIDKLRHFCNDDVIRIRDNVAFTDNCEISGVNIPNTTISCSNIKTVLSCFNKANFKKELIHLIGEDIEGVMASMVS
jgi:hypothetical protein